MCCIFHVNRKVRKAISISNMACSIPAKAIDAKSSHVLSDSKCSCVIRDIIFKFTYHSCWPKQITPCAFCTRNIIRFHFKY